MADAMVMVRYRPVIRVFVSSTFTDLKMERDALQREVFPRLEQLCARRQFQFQAIDLRWGVPTEANLDHRTMRICFEELRRAQEISPQPNFLILLGNRYGWRPLPEEIFPEEFAKLEAVASAEERAVLNAWYRRDDNALPPVYLLQSRCQHLTDGKDYTDEETWRRVQALLWSVINRAFPPSLLDTRFEQMVGLNQPLPTAVRFQASATEQEIWRGALAVDNAREHILTFIREIDNISHFPDPRVIRDFVDVDESGRIDTRLQNALSQLKQKLRAHLGPKKVSELRAELKRIGNGATVSPGHIKSLCEWVYNELEKIINRQIDEFWRTTGVEIPQTRKLELELAEHRRFGQERAPVATFVGREKQLKRIQEYITGSDPRILVVCGPSGCGKTALLARAVQEAEKRYQPIVRFIGVTPESGNIAGLLTSLCQELRQRNPLSNPLPKELGELIKEFNQHIYSATRQKPLLLFLDALDQLSDTGDGRSLKWLPTGELPEYVRIVVSCLSDRAETDPAGEPYRVLKARKIGKREFLDLSCLSESEAQTLLFERWLAQAGRQLNQEQTERVKRQIKKEVCRQPLYLRVLFEEIRLWHSYDPVPELPGEITGIITALLNRLQAPANHGITVETALSYLSSARRGLTENEILEILYSDPEYQKWLKGVATRTGHKLPESPKRIPVAIWSRLRYDLAPYLTEHSAPGGPVLNFYHRQFGDCVRNLFLDSEPKIKAWQGRLADYFDRQNVNLRQADELPYLLRQLDEQNRLRDCLLNIDRFLLMEQTSELELRGYWLWLEEERVMGQAYLKSFADWAKRPGRRETEISYSANELAVFLHDSALYKEAEPLFRRALAINEKSFGRDHPTVARDLSNLASLLYETNRHQEAEPLFRRALAIDEKSFGRDHPTVAIRLNNLALLLKDTNRHQEAEPLLRRALAIDEKSFGRDHPTVARDLNNLALLLQDTNRHQEAEPLFRRALAINEKSFGRDHPRVASDLNNLALLLQDTNRHQEAEPLFRRALAINEKSFGRDHPKVATHLNNLALLLQATNRHQEAEPLFRRALAIDEKSFGRDHPTVATDLNNLALLLQDTNRHQEAEPLFRRAVEILLEFTRTTGHPHPNLQAAVENYASLLQALGHSPDEMRRNVIELGRRYGVNLSDAIAHVASAPPPKLRAVIEEMMRNQSKIPEIIARLEQEDPALLLELIKWIKSRQS